jgi:sec-independent protein translocase protein TatA
MFGISGEHILILSIVLLLFGPRRLPELGNTMGKAIRNFKDALAGVEEASFRKLGDPAQPSHQIPAQTETARMDSAAASATTPQAPSETQQT